MSSCPTTLPSSWYTSKAIYDLEKRAVFHKSWMLLGVCTRWPNAKEDYSYDLVQVKLIVRRETEDWRSTKVYYEEDGTEARSHLTHTGLLFVTLSADSVSFDEFFPGLEDLIRNVEFMQFTHRRHLNYQGHYNWKTMIDGFQECLHCPYAHPTFSKVYTFVTYKVLNRHNYSQHLAASDKPNDGLFLYFFPNSTLNMYGGGMSTFRVCPSDDPSHARMDFDYHHHCPVGSDEFERYFKFARTVAIEDHELCEKAQENLDVGVYTEGILNPAKENGVAYYQGRVLEMCVAQFEEEEREKAASDLPAREADSVQVVDAAAA